MIEGQLVYVRDQLHNHYRKWGRAIFLRNSSRGYMVEFLWSQSGTPMGVCGFFSECKCTLDKGDEVLERVYA